MKTFTAVVERCPETGVLFSPLTYIGLYLQARLDPARRPCFISSVLILAIIASGCAGQVGIPSPAQDRAPVITIVNFPSGGGNTNPENISATGTVFVNYGTHVLVLANARNPGGVSNFSLKITQAGRVLYTVRTTAVPDATRQVPDILYILGSDGAGQAGGRVALLFTEDGTPVTTEAQATNFNGMSTSIVVTYVCADCVRGGYPPVVGGGTLSGPRCGTGTCNVGTICCNNSCVVNDPQNCGECGKTCPLGFVCEGQQCVASGPPSPPCARINEACVPDRFPGTHCCQSPTPEVCNFQVCKGCTPHGEVCPTFGSQICCNAIDQCVLDPSDGQVRCDLPDCSGPDCPK